MGVLSNDSDVEGDSLTITAVIQGANGTVTTDAASVTYTPAENFNGSDSFSYTISDGNGGTATAQVDVTVTAVNDDPVAADDTAGTAEDTAVTVDVLSNDSDVEGDSLTITAVIQGANGTVTTDGASVTYTPNADYNGSDTFNCTVSDGNGGTATAIVTVTVNPVNDAPVNSVPGLQVLERKGKGKKDKGRGKKDQRDKEDRKDTVLVLSADNENAISVADIDVGAAKLQVDLSIDDGTVTLNSIAGLTFLAGDGRADPSMSFTGTIDDINTALDGAFYAPPKRGYSGTDTLTITTNDQGYSGAGGPLGDSDTVDITVGALESDLAANITGPHTASLITPVTYDITITNSGPANGTELVVTYTLSAGVFDAAENDGWNPAGDNVWTYDLGDLDEGDSESLTVVVSTPDTEGKMKNSVEVTGEEHDAKLKNNTDKADTNVEKEKKGKGGKK